jgi:hypothetical protein
MSHLNRSRAKQVPLPYLRQVGDICTVVHRRSLESFDIRIQDLGSIGGTSPGDVEGRIGFFGAGDNRVQKSCNHISDHVDGVVFAAGDADGDASVGGLWDNICCYTTCNTACIECRRAEELAGRKGEFEHVQSDNRIGEIVDGADTQPRVCEVCGLALHVQIQAQTAFVATSKLALLARRRCRHGRSC